MTEQERKACRANLALAARAVALAKDAALKDPETLEEVGICDKCWFEGFKAGLGLLFPDVPEEAVVDELLREALRLGRNVERR